MSACGEVRLELGGYVVAGLTEAESQNVEAHLRGCSACRDELRRLAELPPLLDLTQRPSAPPPEHLRSAVLGEATRRHQRRKPSAALLAATLSAALLFGAGGVVVGDLLRDAAEAPATRVALSPSAGQQASGHLGVTPTETGVRFDLQLSDLGPLRGPAVYEAWLSGADGPPLSIGTFRADGRGQAVVRLWAAGPLDRYEGFWVTVEPDHVDPAHDGPTVISAQLPQT